MIIAEYETREVYKYGTMEVQQYDGIPIQNMKM